MRSSRKQIGLTSLVLVLILAMVALAKAQAIDDWIRLRGYSPPAGIAKIAGEDKLTAKAEHILYVTHPVLDTNPTDFAQRCSQTEQTIVLGCYHSGLSAFTGDSFLFVKAVNDPRLNGVEEVTTAHEMLHAAYDRLSASQKQSIDKMLLDYYNNDLHDQRIIDTMNSYKQTEPDDVVNEMHSVFGTEIANLPAPLENYYKQYFIDRQAVTAFAQNYEGEFTSRLNQIKADDTKLAQEKADIQSKEFQLQTDLAGIEADRARVEASNDEATINQYNSRVSAYNSSVRQLRNEISAYNSLVEQRNQIANELRSLQNSLTSQLTTQ
jgi:hypothetical protein